ncbi:MAG: hypothetical protein ACP5SH_01615 [Syntrophobacteraceae bacterium]
MEGSRKVRSGCRYCMILGLSLVAAAWTVSVSATGEPAGQKVGQTVMKAVPSPPPAHPGATGTQVSSLQAAISALQSAASTQVVKPVPQQGLPPGVATTAAKETPEQISAIVKKTATLLAAAKFTFLPDKGLDPFVPFISMQADAGNGAPATGPLTPLQKMTLAEMQRGLKAIVWGGLGRMAVIEDSTGKGYIVGVGTPAGPNGGVITQLNDSSFVVQQQVWNTQTRKRVPEDFTVKIVKKDNESL